MKSTNPSRLGSVAAAVVTAAGLLLVSGCTGYRLGSTLPPGVNSVHVPTFVNKTGEPGLETLATSACAQEIQRDGTLKLAGASSADAILEVTLIKYETTPVRSDADNTRATAEYRQEITADVLFKKRTSGEVISQITVRGDSTFQPGGDMTSARRADLPACVSDLAHDIVERVVEYW